MTKPLKTMGPFAGGPHAGGMVPQIMSCARREKNRRTATIFRTTLFAPAQIRH
jgi:hypothetical protein